MIDPIWEEQQGREICNPMTPISGNCQSSHRWFELHTDCIVSVHDHLINVRELTLQLNYGLHLGGVATEHIINNVESSNMALDRFQNYISISQEEPICDMNLGRIFHHDGIEIQVTVADSSLRRTCLDQDPNTSKGGGLVIAVHPSDYIGLSADHNSNGGGEDGDVGDGVVVAGELNGGAGEVPLADVAADGGMLAEKGGGNESLVAAVDEDSLGGEVEEEAVGDADPGGVGQEKTAASEAGIEEDVSESDVLVVDSEVLGFAVGAIQRIKGGCGAFLRIRWP